MVHGTCGIMVMYLLYKFNVMVKCMCYMYLGSNCYFVTIASLSGGHYRAYIISGVGPSEVGLSHAASIIDGIVQYPRNRYCITGPSGQYQPF
jgi:hypothetical protein